MATITQQAITLNSQNQLRNADRLARDWAIAHAGSYQSQARKELGGSLPLREWKNDNLTIRIAKLTSGSFKQVQLVSVNYAPADGAEPYAGYIMTCVRSETEQSGGHCISVASLPDALPSAGFPWDDKAGPVGLERAMASITADRARPAANSGKARSITAIDDLFTVHDAAIVLTEDGQQAAEFQELADAHGDWTAVVSISASEQLAIGRELSDHQLPAWIRAEIALFSRYADADGGRLRMAETDWARATAFLDAERDRVVNEIAGSGAMTAFQVLESVSVLLSISMLTDAKDIAEALVESAEKAQPAETDADNNVANQQRIYILEDQLSEANNTIAELQERLAQYENYEPDADTDAEADQSEDLSPESVLDGNRYDAVVNAVTEPDRFPKLRFLTNWDKALPGYGKPRPSGTEIVSALDAINKLAQAWHNTPDGKIGPWDNYFHGLTGWTHANGESDFTMSRYGDKRSFSDQDHGRQVTIERHLTYRGSSGGLQIYFDRDDITNTFIVGYIGEHLPYATNRS